MIYNESNKNVVSVIYDKNELPHIESSTLSSTSDESSTLPSTVPLV